MNASIKQNEDKIASFEEQIKILNDQLTSNAKKAKDISTEKEMQALSVEEDIAKEKLRFANEEIDRLNGVNDARKSLLEEASQRLQARHRITSYNVCYTKLLRCSWSVTHVTIFIFCIIVPTTFFSIYFVVRRVHSAVDTS